MIKNKDENLFLHDASSVQTKNQVWNYKIIVFLDFCCNSKAKLKRNQILTIHSFAKKLCIKCTCITCGNYMQGGALIWLPPQPPYFTIEPCTAMAISWWDITIWRQSERIINIVTDHFHRPCTCCVACLARRSI